MLTPYDVPPSKLIEKLAEELEKEPEISPPEWAKFVKTGPHRQRPPKQKNWWYLRVASLLYQVYMRGPIGVGHLRKLYGGRKKGKSRPEHKKNAAAKIIRYGLQQLESAGLIIKTTKGRKISPKGNKLLLSVATDVGKQLGIA